jgi:hypothetical protein
LGLGIEVGGRGIEADDERRAIPFLAGHRRAYAGRLNQTGQGGSQSSRGRPLDQMTPGQRRRMRSLAEITGFLHFDSLVHAIGGVRATDCLSENGRQGTIVHRHCQPVGTPCGV